MRHTTLKLAPGEQDVDNWFQFEDALAFLDESLTASATLYLSLDSDHSHAFVAAALLPARLITGNAVNELMRWSTNVLEQRWGYGGGFHEDGSPDYTLIPPFAWERPAIIQHAVPILWRRENSCEKGRPTYYEANPEITHPHDLHWIEERSAYCTLDELGDVRDVIIMHHDQERGRVVEITMLDEILARHMALGDYALVRFFDIDRFRDRSIIGFDSPEHASVEQVEREGIRARLTRIPGEHGAVRAYLRGVQINPPPRGAAKKALLDDRKQREYESFISFDWKHQRVAEISCAPEALDNYFTDTDKPFETTPAFFRREVLLRYQADSDKYTVTDRQIHCRSSWSLDFDVNEARQVHAYLIDLQHLPYAEQKYWRSFNEEPQAGISKRAFQTDFAGRWDLDPEPLRDLKARLSAPISLKAANHNSAIIWAPPREQRYYDEVHYLASESEKEWRESIGTLHRLVVEGLQENALRQLARDLGEQEPAVKDLRSIRLLERVLRRLGHGDDMVGEIIVPLVELNELRSKTASHRQGEDAKLLIRNARKEHGNLASHFRVLVRDVDGTVQKLRVLQSAAAATDDASPDRR